MNEDILARSMPLVFTSHGAKRFAETPAGEFAYSDAQGLYEWRRVPFDYPDGSMVPGPGTISQRIDYTGGDRQASDASGFFSHGSSGSRDTEWPALLGFHAAVSPARLN